MHTLTQTESRLEAAHDDLLALYEEITGEDLRSVAAKEAVKIIVFYLPTVLGYIKKVKNKDVEQ